MPCGTLHVVLTEDHEIAVDPSPAAQYYMGLATAMLTGRSAAEHHEDLRPRSGNRRAITVAVLAHILSMENPLAQTGLPLASQGTLCCQTPQAFIVYARRVVLCGLCNGIC